MKPSVGRIVHYIFEGQTCAAFVCHVHSDTVINVAWFTPNGMPGSATSVDFNADGAEKTWRWPPRV